MNMTTPTKARLPDFIIGGAPKCGTTSVHFILAQNPDIGMPDEEIHYFDADDPICHPDFVHVSKAQITWFDPAPDQADSLAWYQSRFVPFAECPLIGEDSTTYFFSAVAAARIKALIPDVRLIFLLRDPVKRAYSQYWHLIRSGRATCSFETALSTQPSIMLGSTYAENLRNYYNLFDAEQVKVAIFEDFIADKQAFMDSMTDFVGAKPLSLETAETWFNKSYYPKRPGLHQLINHVGSRVVSTRYHNHMGMNSGFSEWLRHKTHYHWFKRVNDPLLTAERPPKMRPETEAYLQKHLSARNHGLSEMLGRPLSEVWRGFID